MQAVILAAGVGSRLGEETADKPKCLIDIGGKPLIVHQLEALADHGIGPVLVTVGHQADRIREVVGDGVEYVVNERYRETNSLYSLSLAKDWVEGPFILLNSDLLFHPDVLDRLIEAKGNALAYDSTSLGGREQTKTAIRDGRVLDIGKDLPKGASGGESLGLLKFDEDGARALFESVDELLARGAENSWVIQATRTVCSTLPVSGVNVAGLAWAEIDFPFDLERARREVWPAIDGGRSKRRSVLRWVYGTAITLLSLTLIVLGWFSSSQVGPASIDWETVKPTGAERVKLIRAKGPQSWWIIDAQQTARARIESTGQVRIEVRSLLPKGSMGRGRYVVEVGVDGEDFDWQLFKATPDTTVWFGEYVVGDRDRIELKLEPGTHEVEVKYLAGTGDKLLVRFRRPE